MLIYSIFSTYSSTYIALMKVETKINISNKFWTTNASKHIKYWKNVEDFWISCFRNHKPEKMLKISSTFFNTQHSHTNLKHFFNVIIFSSDDTCRVLEQAWRQCWRVEQVSSRKEKIWFKLAHIELASFNQRKPFF